MLGFQRMKAMAKHRSHSVAFKRQVAQEFIGGETLHGLSKRHDISRQLIRIWVQKYEAGALDDDVQAADLLQEYEAKIAALEQQEPATEPRREVGSTFNLMIGRDEHNLAERARCQVFGATLAAQHRPRIGALEMKDKCAMSQSAGTPSEHRSVTISAANEQTSSACGCAIARARSGAELAAVEV
jgi:transposase-like protein